MQRRNIDATALSQLHWDYWLCLTFFSFDKYIANVNGGIFTMSQPKVGPHLCDALPGGDLIHSAQVNGVRLLRAGFGFFNEHF